MEQQIQNTVGVHLGKFQNDIPKADWIVAAGQFGTIMDRIQGI